MTVLVVHAGVLVVALTGGGADGCNARTRLRGEDLAAPALVDLDVASVLRRHTESGLTDVRRASPAVVDRVAMPLRRAPHQPLLTRAWELRQSLTIYDAAYVSLVEALQVSLFTTDRGLGRAAGPRSRIEILSPTR